MATVSLGGTLPEKLAAISAAEFDGIELLDDDLRCSGLRAAEVSTRCRDLGLEIDLYQPFRRAEGVTESEFAEVLSRFRVELETMHALGVDNILVVSNTDADADPSFERSAGQLGRLASLAAENGIAVRFEALSWGTAINTAAHSWHVIREADHPNLSVVIDTFHSLARGEGPEQWEAIPAGAVGFVQLSDAPWMTGDLKEWSRNHRCFPGEGEFDLVSALDFLLNGGYSGPISLEIFNPGYRQRPPGEVAMRGADALRELFDRTPALMTREGSPEPTGPHFVER